MLLKTCAERISFTPCGLSLTGRERERTPLLAQHCTAAEWEARTPGLKQDPNASDKTCPKTTHELAWLFSEVKVISRIWSSPEKLLLPSKKHWK